MIPTTMLSSQNLKIPKLLLLLSQVSPKCQSQSPDLSMNRMIRIKVFQLPILEST